MHKISVKLAKAIRYLSSVHKNNSSAYSKGVNLRRFPRRVRIFHTGFPV